MQKSCDQLLAGSTLPLYEYRRVAVENRIDSGVNFSHRSSIAKYDCLAGQSRRIYVKALDHFS